MATDRRNSWWRPLLRIARFERGVFAEIGADRRATWQGLGIVLVASRAQLLGAALAVPLYVRAIAETQRVRLGVGVVAVSVPIMLYAAFFVYYAAFVD